MHRGPNWPERYQSWSHEAFGRALPVYIPDIVGAFSFPPDSPHFQTIWNAMESVELSIIDQYIKDIGDKNIPGAVAEFGIYQGNWINRLYVSLERQQIQREVWGFDSFEGLPAPDKERDSPGWIEGSFAATIDMVRTQVRAAERPNIKLVPGWYCDSLKGEQAQSLEKISLARIDCDLYASTIDVLNYLSDRLSHGSIIIFDDWPHDIDVGEARAFAEWRLTVPHLEFEFLFFTGWYHFYVRCWHKGQPRWALPA